MVFKCSLTELLLQLQGLYFLQWVTNIDKNSKTYMTNFLSEGWFQSWPLHFTENSIKRNMMEYENLQWTPPSAVSRSRCEASSQQGVTCFQQQITRQLMLPKSGQLSPSSAVCTWEHQNKKKFKKSFLRPMWKCSGFEGTLWSGGVTVITAAMVIDSGGEW